MPRVIVAILAMAGQAFFKSAAAMDFMDAVGSYMEFEEGKALSGEDKKLQDASFLKSWFTGFDTMAGAVQNTSILIKVLEAAGDSALSHAWQSLSRSIK